jgi:hypothetical protein
VNGNYTYIHGTETKGTARAVIPVIPQGSLLVSFIAFSPGKVEFTSLHEQQYLHFIMDIRLGDYYLARRVEYLQGKQREIYYWTMSGAQRNEFNLFGFKSEQGVVSLDGTLELFIEPLEEEGPLIVTIYEPGLHRDQTQGARISIDNISLTERALDNVSKMYITGENEGRINTPPYELTLYHGSGIPRTEALITFADGTPTFLWNQGNLLQELTARSILRQHQRAGLTLHASLRGPVSPLSVLKDNFLPGARFFVDSFAYRVREGLTQVSALEVFGGLEETAPEGAIHTEDFRPISSQDFNFIIKER